MRHACWCVKVSGLLWLNVWLLKEHLDWILDFLHFHYFDQAGSILDWVWHSLCVGYLINPLYISLSRHGDLISPRLVILFSEHGDLKNSIQVMLFSQHGEHIKSRLAMSFSTHEARIKPRLICHFPDREISGNPKLEMSCSKHGDNINPWEVIYLPNLENWNIHDWMLCRSYLGYCDFHVLPVLDTDMRQVWNLS